MPDTPGGHFLKRLLRWLDPKNARTVLFMAGLALTAGFTALHWARPDWLAFLDYKVYDVLLSNRPRHEPTGRVTVVDVDEKSLAEIGQFPWPRYRAALLLSMLKQYGALAVGMDVVFSEPDRTSPERIRRDLASLGLDVDFTGLPEGLRDNDELLARNLAQGPYVLGYFFTFKAADGAAGQEACTLPPSRVAVRRAPGTGPWPVRVAAATSVVCPLPSLSKSGGWAGFFNSFPDLDNIVRRVPLAIAWKGNIYPSLAVAAIMRAFGDKSAVLAVADNPYGGQDLSYSLDLGELGIRTVPLDEGGRLLLDFRGPARTFDYVSASDVMAGRAPRDKLEGRIVFIGTSARGLEDVRATPAGQEYPGVEAHATLADMILADTFIRRPPEAWYIEQVLLAAFGLGVTFTLVRARSLWVGAASLAAGTGMWLAAQASMNRLDMYISPLTPLMALAASFTLLTFLKFLREERRRRFVQSAFSHYVSPQVVDQLVAEPEKLNLSGEEKDVTVLFSDVRGFTTMSEKLTPTQVVDLLHEYLTPMTRLIRENSGTMDKFIGDAIMAFWNAPADVPDHPRLAVETSLAMLRELDRLNAGFRDRYGFGIEIGIGLNRGMARVGNFGSEDLFDYTLIGDNVNLCSRLEGLTKYYHQRILASQAVRDGAGEGFAWREVDRVRVKGKHEPVTIHSIMERDGPEARDELARWEEGLALYRDARFKEALDAFEALESFTGDKLYGLYAQRCRDMIQTPPLPGWDGVFEHTSK